MSIGFLLDTSAINRICNGEVNADRWRPAFITDVVLRELCATTDQSRRAQLLGVLDGRLAPGGILRSERHIGAADAAGVWAGPALSLGRMFPLVTATIGRNFRKHWHDGFIAQAAIQHSLTLVTSDKKLAVAARAFGVSVEFIG